ncbi:phosphonate metabolism protein PhnM [Aureimonas endophytica]|uniref:Phosphonate metabolism protein PhnM n=1 Tax=Aureimonas endophytica TaxID=2027858 RepID=A0A916ZHE4_9HYPH|nr:alpha-D-ribose 1-methylphosphonate 5-triphosphate diphosphatase [Aureimonas endophytica]GGD97708.1 phosphonate metabolism protein PhnM [Aureimonas endophytica]
MPSETLFRNARIVLADRILDGHLLLRDGRIAEIGEGPATGGEDFGGDYLIPGLVELHTDHIENHSRPRPKVQWNPAAALQAHDVQIAGSGITTVFDALRVGQDEADDTGEMAELGRTIAAAVAADRLRAEHFIHLRCEVSAPDTLECFLAMKDNPRVRLASLMDHAPGQRQFASLDAYRVYYQGKKGMTDPVFAAFCARRIEQSETYSDRHRRAIAAECHAAGIAIASHDDATAAHVDESIALGVAVAEFPTTLDAARLSREAGLHVLMGAPNVVRGGSHSGNVSAIELMRAGVLDVLSSDYVPASLLQAAFLMVERGDADLPAAIRLVATHPAEAVGLADRGAIAIGRRADLVRVEAPAGEPPLVRAVYREGRRVA